MTSHKSSLACAFDFNNYDGGKNKLSANWFRCDWMWRMSCRYNNADQYEKRIYIPYTNKMAILNMRSWRPDIGVQWKLIRVWTVAAAGFLIGRGGGGGAGGKTSLFSGDGDKPKRGVFTFGLNSQKHFVCGGGGGQLTSKRKMEWGCSHVSYPWRCHRVWMRWGVITLATISWVKGEVVVGYDIVARVGPHCSSKK